MLVRRIGRWQFFRAVQHPLYSLLLLLLHVLLLLLPVTLEGFHRRSQLMAHGDGSLQLTFVLSERHMAQLLPVSQAPGSK